MRQLLYSFQGSSSPAVPFTHPDMVLTAV